ncbi:MAG: hypothetical protein K8R88_14435, partial [Armatimonadetes bacterium]|nr:hypothetical protein [Armatimonadota bacterium]
VFAASIKDGVYFFTVRRQANKVFEVYDRLAVGMVGQQSDVENLRIGAIDFAHQEGFQRSEQDVTIHRAVNALSGPLKRAFGDFNTAPFIVRALFAEVGATPADDCFYVMDYDGDYTVRKHFAFVAGSPEASDAIQAATSSVEWSDLTLAAARKIMETTWAKTIDPEGSRDFAKLTENLTPESAILRRGTFDSAFLSL